MRWNLLLAAFAVGEFEHAGIFIHTRFAVAGQHLAVGGGDDDDVFAAAAGQAEQA